MDRGRYYGVPRRPKPPAEPLTSFDPIDAGLRYYCCDCRKAVLPIEHDAEHRGEHVIFPINEARLANNAVDAEIVLLLRALIVMGFGTLFSCYGHMERVGVNKPTFPYVVFRAPAIKVEPLRSALQRITGRLLEIRPDGDNWRLAATSETARRSTVRDVQTLFDQLADGLGSAAQQVQRARRTVS